ncbi:hypothetical protein [Stutzerimonas balearica]|uniref:hypothetical protein n=1 Tax=Stutzerimonas balearica TaxID=74829 RepID=UPI00190BB575|nr:hypothetical protein [Stutzerimonas balearica]MBK3749281.1 hypothetical protein [Stutzerimonas balearica]MBK3827476.1 hypothetical protein [Stutzerimonas balearica]
MLIGDRVFCDCCGNDMGKLMGLPAPQSDLLPDLSLPPHVAVCPDCEPSEQTADLEQAGE